MNKIQHNQNNFLKQLLDLLEVKPEAILPMILSQNQINKMKRLSKGH